MRRGSIKINQELNFTKISVTDVNQGEAVNVWEVQATNKVGQAMNRTELRTEREFRESSKLLFLFNTPLFQSSRRSMPPSSLSSPP